MDDAELGELLWCSSCSGGNLGFEFAELTARKGIPYKVKCPAAVNKVT